MDNPSLIARFRAIPLDNKQNAHMQTLRADALKMADHINQFAKDGREKSLAVTTLEEAVMWACRAIATAPETK